ncbi:hypothetical protein BGZ99_010490 [Dissophora globulifera]|uniref:Asparagine synthetase domain-containing protein n=1 Tax=Dissophora globulifera TaxID=979702 RepID=A0A9P6R1Q0_9FUNG|nr:hypothetical protein BGZ99_010490 [Dissophora globulifera]
MVIPAEAQYPSRSVCQAVHRIILIRGLPLRSRHTQPLQLIFTLFILAGPSAQDTHVDHAGDMELTFYGAVLHLRGDTVARQPHVSSRTGDVLIWNGEIFDGIFVDHHQNDGKVLMDRLDAISDKGSSQQAHAGLFLQIMATIEGPYAFVYYHASCFSDDLFWTGLPCELLPLEEVPADGIYSLSLNLAGDNTIARYPWLASSAVESQHVLTGPPLYMQLPFGRVNDSVPTDSQLSEPFPEDAKFDLAHPGIVPPITEDMKQGISDMIRVLGDSVKRRVQDIPRTGLPHEARVGILFSGGLDCLCLAALADRFLPEGEAIDLLNVGFENPRSVKAKAAEDALNLKRLKKQNARSSGANQGAINQSNIVDGSSITSGPNSQSSSTFNVPDRITGYESLAELRRIAPGRHWNFVEINVPFEEATAHRAEILERIAPLETVMDLSIAMAFWFASRGIGYLKNNHGELVPYTSQAKVLLSGLGADEQLGGYSRHKEQFKTASWKGLIESLQLDVDRISTRNLGRDDRIISDHGKEARYPFLCTNVVQFLSSLRVDLKVDLRYPRGVGEKILLRHVARQLGFRHASSHWKRAVQFGARTAKMTEGGRTEVGQQIVDRSAE